MGSNASTTMSSDPTAIAPVENITAHLRSGALVLDVRNPDELARLGDAVPGTTHKKLVLF